jgi:hypothetical protein
MKAKVGLHYFGRSGNTWGIWCYDCVNEETGFSSAQKVTNVCTYEQAVKTTYQLNGWGEPKYIKRNF